VETRRPHRGLRPREADRTSRVVGSDRALRAGHFDSDGVLVDSEPIANRVLAEYLTELGRPTTYEDSIRDYMGSTVHRIHELILECTGRPLPEDFDEVFHTRLFAAFRRELRPVDGVAAVLDMLSASGVPYCVGSSGSHERIRVALHRTGLYGRFGEDVIFNSQDVGRGKPAPDLFLHAATLGTPPERCAVVEDSPLGVQVALAAGMDVDRFTAMTPAARLGSATALFGDMAEMPGLLA
jgi:HAD superfamily hydrolase (TIGR01509 family)